MINFSEWKVGRVYRTSSSLMSAYKIDEKGHVYNREKDSKKWKYSYSKHNWFVNQEWREVMIQFTFDEAKEDCEKTGQNYICHIDDTVIKTTVYMMLMLGTLQLHVCSEDKQHFIPLTGRWYKYDQ